MKWYHLLLIVAACVLSFLCGLRVRRLPATDTEVKEVTKYYYDTVTIEKPVYVDRYYRDSIKVFIKDTVRVHDTSYMYLPREHRVYVDSMYRAVVSGYDPRLDTMEVYSRTIENTVRYTPKLSFGLQAGYGLTYNNGLAFSPYLGLGITYRF